LPHVPAHLVCAPLCLEGHDSLQGSFMLLLAQGEVSPSSSKTCLKLCCRLVAAQAVRLKVHLQAGREGGRVRTQAKLRVSTSKGVETERPNKQDVLPAQTNGQHRDTNTH